MCILLVVWSSRLPYHNIPPACYGIKMSNWGVSLLFHYVFTGKARRLKQAKEEAQDEIEKYRQERERQFKEFEAKVCIPFSCVFPLDLSWVLIIQLSLQHMGSREDVSARIEADTKLRINEMNKAVTLHKEQVFICCQSLMQLAQQSNV